MAASESAARAALAGKIQTVLGPIAPGACGRTMMHEHLLIDARRLEPRPADPAGLQVYQAPYTANLLGRLVFDGLPNRDNAVMDDIESAVWELGLFKAAGGGTVVEVTSGGIGRNPHGLVKISEAAGVNVVMGASYYVDAAHPSEVARLGESALADRIVADVLFGADGGAVHAGIIGEVGCSWPLTAAERKVLRASAEAQRRTGAPLSIHPGRDERAPFEIVDILEDAGADPSRTIMCHIERTIFDLGRIRELAQRACIMEFDMFGHEFSYYWPAPHIATLNDGGRMDRIDFLISEGFEHQLVVSHDHDAKMWLSKFGGPGYGHILRNIVPRMLARGIPKETVDRMLIDTPRRLLTVAAPR